MIIITIAVYYMKCILSSLFWYYFSIFYKMHFPLYGLAPLTGSLPSAFARFASAYGVSGMGKGAGWGEAKEGRTEKQSETK